MAMSQMKRLVVIDGMHKSIQDEIMEKLAGCSAAWSKRDTVASVKKDVSKLEKQLSELKHLVFDSEKSSLEKILKLKDLQQSIAAIEQSLDSLKD